MAKGRYHSTRLKERKKRKRIIVSILSVILFIGLVAGFSYLSKLETFKIQEVEVNELRFINQEEIKEIANRNIDGNYIWLFSRSNSMLFPDRSIEKEIRDKYHSVKKVNASFAGFKRIKINIIEHDPVAKWCDTSVIFKEEILEHASTTESVIPYIGGESDETNCYFINEEGMVFVEEPEIHLDKYISFFGLIDQNPLGKNFSDKKEFSELLDLTRLIRRLDISILEVWTKTGEVYVLVTEPGAKLYVDSEDDIVSVFRNLETLIEQDAINKAQFGNIEYIDLRFGNRVFYRLR